MTRRGFAAPIVLIGVLVLLLVVGGAYYLGKTSSPVTAPLPSSTSAAVSTPASSVNPTAGWRTYTSNTYGFLIKYSPLATLADEGQIQSVEDRVTIKAPVSVGPGDYDATVSVWVLDPVVSTDKWTITSEAQSYRNGGPRWGRVASGNETAILDTTFAGQPAKTYTENNTKDCSTAGICDNRRHYFVSNGKHVFLVAQTYGVNPTNGQTYGKEIVDQILSTFKFTQ